MTWKGLQSSNLAAYDYDEESEELVIKFRSGRIYSYSGVEKDVADGLETASSPGGYFYAHIKDSYPYMNASGKLAHGMGPKAIKRGMKESEEISEAVPRGGGPKGDLGGEAE